MKHTVKTASDIRKWVTEGLNSYLQDPPNTDFQKGHMVALYEVRKFILGEEL